MMKIDLEPICKPKIAPISALPSTNAESAFVSRINADPQVRQPRTLDDGVALALRKS